MSSRFFVALGSALVFFVSFVSVAKAQEVIRAFEVRAEIREDRTLIVDERIQYDFGRGQRHGIFRVIPETYERDGGSYRLRLSIQDVQMDGRDVPYEVQREGRNIRVKIGDVEQFVTGLHTYRIRYETGRSINDFSDHAEWYWNVTGHDWPVAIERASMTVESPSSTQRACFVGVFGSRDTRCRWVEDAFLTASSTRALNPYEGLTVVLGFPREAFRVVSPLERLGWFLEDNGWVVLPLLTFLIMWMIWYRWGKEPEGRGTVVPHYEEPRALPPGLQAALTQQFFSSRAVTATILDLARRGYLRLQWEGEKEFAFVRERAADGGMHAFEKEIFEGLFGKLGVLVRPTMVRATFYEAVERARKEAFKELQTYKWFLSNPVTIRVLWIGGAVAFSLLAILFSDQLPIQIVASIVCGIIIAAFGWQMPKMTKEGAVVAEEVEGFKWFLSVTEEKRLAFSDAPAKKPEQFARFLPAAVAFGVEKDWAKQFSGMMVAPPAYVHGAWNGWSALHMAEAVDTLHHTNASSMYAAPSSAGSGGSGFSGGGSGGGFGGGGGGSW